MDPETDYILQKMMKAEFKHATILTIAHRLQMVVHDDKVLVLSNGSAVEFDSPQILIEAKGTFTP